MLYALYPITTRPVQKMKILAYIPVVVNSHSGHGTDPRAALAVSLALTFLIILFWVITYTSDCIRLKKLLPLHDSYSGLNELASILMVLLFVVWLVVGTSYLIYYIIK